MAKSGYNAVTAGTVALAATVPKTVLGVKSHANFGLDLQSVWFDFDGLTSTNAVVYCELMYCTWATNSPGTNSTSVTPANVYGRQITTGFTAGKTWTTEPTALTLLDDMTLDPNKGVYRWPFALGQTYDCDLGHGFALRFTAPNIVNVHAGMTVERC